MFLKQSTAYTFRLGPFVDDTDGKTAETGLTIEDSHVRVSKNGGNFIDKAETSNSAHDEAGFYVVVFNTTDTNTVGELQVACHISGALPVFKTFYVVEEAIYDALFAGSATGALTGVSVNALTSAAITDVWSEDPLVEAYAADGSAGTAAQLLYMIWSCINDFSISSTTITSKKLDGDTSALEWSIDDASSPTSRSRNTNPS
tara:strand:+ start:95 stop:700 length:606 start_codon:yes stop_codon:yes gene_type:complete